MMPILARIVFTGWRISTKPIDRQDECFRQGLGLARLALRPGLVNHWLRLVMKEVNEGIKIRVADLQPCLEMRESTPSLPTGYSRASGSAARTRSCTPSVAPSTPRIEACSPAANVAPSQSSLPCVRCVSIPHR
jgi:hypothetical protein